MTGELDEMAGDEDDVDDVFLLDVPPLGADNSVVEDEIED